MPDSNAISQRGPWQRLTDKLIYDNPWIQLRHQDVITPAGTTGIYGLVHFKTRALGIITMDADGNTLLVGQHRYALDAFSWEIPMGGGDLEDTPLEAAKRELAEETGIRAENWQQVLFLHTSNSVTDEEAYVYLARDLAQGPQALEDTEQDLSVKKLPFAEAVEMVMQGQITDAISVAGILAVQRTLEPLD